MIIDVKELYEKLEEKMNTEVSLQGWVRNHRKQKEFGFIDFNDGTFFKNVQIVYDNKLENFEENCLISGMAVKKAFSKVSEAYHLLGVPIRP